MTLPEHALKYDICSLQELRQFVNDRKILFKYTRAQSHTKKSQIRKEKEERRKLLAALQKDDAAATFRLLDLPAELRDEVYWHFFMSNELLMVTDNRQYLQRVPDQIRDEMNTVFDAVRQRREVREKIGGARSSGNIRLGVDLGISHLYVHNPAWASQMSRFSPGRAAASVRVTSLDFRLRLKNSMNITLHTAPRQETLRDYMKRHPF